MSVAHHDICFEAKDVSYQYGNDLVLEDVTFQIRAGEYVGLVGPNGAGKTTLLNILVGLLKPTSGTVRVFGHTIETAREHVEIGFVPQRVAAIDLAFPATVKEIVMSGRTRRLRFGRKRQAEDERAVQSAMELTGVEGLQDKRIGELSGGQMQRAFIARALAAEPKVLILDEPTVGVDAGAIAAFYSLMHELNRNHGLTILIVSHDIDAVAREVTTVLCLNKRLVCHVPSADFTAEVYNKRLYGSYTKSVSHADDKS